MIKLSEEEKRLIKELDHPTYTAEWVEEWANRNDNVFVNAPAALQAMGAKGFYEAVRSLLGMLEYERLKEMDRAMKPIIEGHDEQDYLRCPSCKEIIAENDTPDEWRSRFCPECGQRIDWSEE